MEHALLGQEAVKEKNMSKSARRLGRGLNSLVSDLRVSAPTTEATIRRGGASEGIDTAEAEAVDLGPNMLPITGLEPNPFQPRDNTSYEDITSLASSIEQSGLLQPVVVRYKSGRYEIIAGERRWRAAQSLGMTRIPVIIRDATDEQMLELALVENIQREDLNAIDRAKAYRRLCSRFGHKPDEIGVRLGEDRTTVVNYLRLLDLPELIQTLVGQSRLSMGHARCLLGVSDDTRRVRLAEAAADKQLSVRALEEIVRREKTRRGESGPKEKEGKRERGRSAHLHDLEQRFEDVVGTKVSIREGKRKGTGRIVIEYYSLDDFDRIAAILGVAAE